ncbi:MAG: hypothetical protein RBR69_06945 [Candidatus Cloacimonadaceae bacterium]|jgi:hypothetical protein|nr:hypothetical protein [Candidatus Cloacimonadota bacterium]MDY0127848.1 hypothetical protein [Candidatus Cloacimonadaceae bacterium]MCB5255304.1 hypothetical protein [Candidatus Cloacimonadota bacterium]MCK9178353.1 hypothetical protein [Candidatus Cloacimonadota bacterium]MCK9242128.1 hypothetical protein [Candidatus Cloacimonadota bacterium]
MISDFDFYIENTWDRGVSVAEDAGPLKIERRLNGWNGFVGFFGGDFIERGLGGSGGFMRILGWNLGKPQREDADSLEIERGLGGSGGFMRIFFGRIPVGQLSGQDFFLA